MILVSVGVILGTVMRVWVYDWIGGQEAGQMGARRYVYLLLEQFFAALPLFVGLTFLLVQYLGKKLVSGARKVFQKPATIWMAALLSFLFSYLIASRVYEFQPITNGDEYSYLFQAKLLASGRLSSPSPPVPEAFKALARVIYNGRWFSVAFPGHPFMLVPGTLLGWPWFSVGLMSFASILFAGLLAKELFDRATAGVVVLLVSFSPHVIYLQGSLLSQTSSSLILLILMYLVILLFKKPSMILAFCAGLVWGGLFLVRPPTALTIALVWVVFWFLRILRNLPFQRWILLALLLCSGFAVGIGLYFFYNACMMGEWFYSPYSLYLQGDLMGWSQYNLKKVIFDNLSNIVKINFYLYGWPVSLIFCGIWFLRGAPELELRVLGFAAFAQFLFYFFFFASHYWYWHEIYIPVTLITARTVVQIVGKSPAPITRGGIKAVACVLSGLTCCLVFLVPFLNTYYSGLVQARSWFFRDLPGLSKPQLIVVQSIPPIPTVPVWRYNGLNDPDLNNSRIYSIESGDDTLDRLFAAFPERQFFHYRYNAQQGRMEAQRIKKIGVTNPTAGKVFKGQTIKE